MTPEMLQQIITTAVTAATTAMNQNRPAPCHGAEKPKRPTNSSGITLEKWSYFLNKWERYKALTGIGEEDCTNHLVECCDEDLQLSLHKTHGSSISEKLEEFVLKQIKRFAVEDQNTLISETSYAVYCRIRVRAPNTTRHALKDKLQFATTR